MGQTVKPEEAERTLQVRNGDGAWLELEAAHHSPGGSGWAGSRDPGAGAGNCRMGARPGWGWGRGWWAGQACGRGRWQGFRVGRGLKGWSGAMYVEGRREGGADAREGVGGASGTRGRG